MQDPYRYNVNPGEADPHQRPPAPPSSQTPSVPHWVEYVFVFSFGGFILFFLIVICLICLFWAFIPQSDPQFSIQSLSISNYNSSVQRQGLSSTWDVRFQVSNPNKKVSISYTHVASSVFYKDSYLLTQTTIQPFHQGFRDVTTVEFSFSLVDSYVDGRVLEGINWDVNSTAQVIFDLKLGAKVILRFGRFSSIGDVKVSCNDVVLSTAGGLLRPPKECMVDCHCCSCFSISTLAI